MSRPHSGPVSALKHSALRQHRTDEAFWRGFQRTGDVVLSRGTAKRAHANRAVQRLARSGRVAEWSHVAMCVVPGLLVEAVPGDGVRFIFADDPANSPFASEEEPAWRVVRRTDLDDGREEALWMASIYLFSQPYSFWFLPSRFDSGLEAYCSELVARIYERANLPVTMLPSDQTWPIDIDAATRSSPWKDITYLYHHHLDNGPSKIRDRNFSATKYLYPDHADLGVRIIRLAHRLRAHETQRQRIIRSIEQEIALTRRGHERRSSIEQSTLETDRSTSSLDFNLCKLCSGFEEFMRRAKIQEDIVDEKHGLTWHEELRTHTDLLDAAKINKLFRGEIYAIDALLRCWYIGFEEVSKALDTIPLSGEASALAVENLRRAIDLLEPLPDAARLRSEWEFALAGLERTCLIAQADLKGQEHLELVRRMLELIGRLQWIAEEGIPTLEATKRLVARDIGMQAREID